MRCNIQFRQQLKKGMERLEAQREMNSAKKPRPKTFLQLACEFTEGLMADTRKGKDKPPK